MKPGQRVQFDEKAYQDKLRYKREMETYVPSEGFQKKKSRIKVVQTAQHLHRHRINKDANAPKRPRSGYMLFAKSMRAKVKDQHPNKKFCEIGRKLGELWRSLSHEKKKVSRLENRFSVSNLYFQSVFARRAGV